MWNIWSEHFEPNANNFETLQECQEMCPEPFCDLPWDLGPCTEAHTRWCFNTETNLCETFVWGGCDGNRNNFETLIRDIFPKNHACKLLKLKTVLLFRPAVISIGSTTNANLLNIVDRAEIKITSCSTPAKTFALWRNREAFTWSGCQENANNFLKESDSENICMLKTRNVLLSWWISFLTGRRICFRISRKEINHSMRYKNK